MAFSLRPRVVAARGLPAAALSALVSAPAADATASSTGDKSRPVKVMTRNVYFGASLTRASQAANQEEFLGAVSTIFSNFHATDFAARAKVLAREIADADPAIIGLQEVALWR